MAKKRIHLLIIFLVVICLFQTRKSILEYKKTTQEQVSIDYFFLKGQTKPLSIAKQTTPTEYYAILEIPKINLKQGLMAPDSPENDVDKHIYIVKESIFPVNNNLSHIILAAHSGYDCVAYFKNLNHLQSGDLVYLYYANHQYTYTVNSTYEIEKNGYLSYQTQNISDVYLITCKKNTNKQLVLIANLTNITDY